MTSCPIVTIASLQKAVSTVPECFPCFLHEINNLIIFYFIGPIGIVKSSPFGFSQFLSCTVYNALIVMKWAFDLSDDLMSVFARYKIQY